MFRHEEISSQEYGWPHTDRLSDTHNAVFGNRILEQSGRAQLAFRLRACGTAYNSVLAVRTLSVSDTFIGRHGGFEKAYLAPFAWSAFFCVHTYWTVYRIGVGALQNHKEEEQEVHFLLRRITIKMTDKRFPNFPVGFQTHTNLSKFLF